MVANSLTVFRHIIEAQGYSNFYQADNGKLQTTAIFIKVIKNTNIPVASSWVIPTKCQVYLFYMIIAFLNTECFSFLPHLNARRLPVRKTTFFTKKMSVLLV